MSYLRDGVTEEIDIGGVTGPASRRTPPRLREGDNRPARGLRYRGEGRWAGVPAARLGCPAGEREIDTSDCSKLSDLTLIVLPAKDTARHSDGHFLRRDVGSALDVPVDARVSKSLPTRATSSAVRLTELPVCARVSRDDTLTASNIATPSWALRRVKTWTVSFGMGRIFPGERLSISCSAECPALAGLQRVRLTGR